MKVCFTGHRMIYNDSAVKNKLNKLLEKLIEQGASDFYAGGAVGFDMLCEDAVIQLRKKYPHIKLHLVLPCHTDEQTEKWSESEKLKFDIIFESADSVEFTSEHYSPDCMKKRNEKLVEYADCCVCYFSGKYVSGTAQTVRMAENKDISVYNIF